MICVGDCAKVFYQSLLLQTKVSGGFKWNFIRKNCFQNIIRLWSLGLFQSLFSWTNTQHWSYKHRANYNLVFTAAHTNNLSRFILKYPSPVWKTLRRNMKFQQRLAALGSGAAGFGQMEGTYCSLMKVRVYRPSCGEKGQVVWLKCYENKAACSTREPLALSHYGW